MNRHGLRSNTTVAFTAAIMFLVGSWRLATENVPRILSEQEWKSSSTHRSEIIPEMPSCSLNITSKPLWRVRKHQGDKWETFSAVISVLNENDVDYFLDYGTLLGFVRECRNFDRDFDFSVSIEWLKKDDNYAMLQSKFASAGFEFLRGNNNTVSNKRMTIDGHFIFKMQLNGFHVDIFFTYTGREGQVENGVAHHGFNTCPRQFSGIETYKWKGLNVKVPVPFDGFLRSTYGDDYMTPKKIKFVPLAEQTLETGLCLMANDVEAELSGLVVVLPDKESISEALALVESMSLWGFGGRVRIEIYHNTLLSDFLQQEFEKHDNVKVFNLPSERDNVNDNERDDLYARALKATKLAEVLITRPSTIFLQNPMNIFETMAYQNSHPMKYNDDGDAIGFDDKFDCRPGAPCVKTTDPHLTTSLSSLDHLALLKTYPRASRPLIVLKDEGATVEGATVEVATLHETGHRVGLFAFPSRDYLDWMGQRQYSGDLFSLRLEAGGVMDLPLAYRRHLQEHWARYEDAKRLVQQDPSLSPPPSKTAVQQFLRKIRVQ